MEGLYERILMWPLFDTRVYVPAGRNHRFGGSIQWIRKDACFIYLSTSEPEIVNYTTFKTCF